METAKIYDCRVGDQAPASCDVDAPLLRGRTIVVSAEDASQVGKKLRAEEAAQVSVSKRGAGVSATHDILLFISV